MSEMCGWLCRAARPGPGVHVWRRGLSPSTPNPSLCVKRNRIWGSPRSSNHITTDLNHRLLTLKTHHWGVFCL